MGNELKRALVDVNTDGATLLEFVAASRGCSKRRAKAMLDARRVFVNRRRVWMAKHRLRSGDIVETVEGAASKRMKCKDELKILKSGNGFCIVDKPAGILTQGARSIESLAREHLGERSIAAVHRLDRDTSGALILALRPQMRERLVELFCQHRVHKQYLALVTGRFPAKRRAIKQSIDGKSAATDVELLQAAAQASLVRCVIHTGRTHQIRRHLESLGYPLAGDKQYGAGEVNNPILRSLPRQMLHASIIEFPEPDGSGMVSAKAPLPADFLRALKSLRIVT